MFVQDGQAAIAQASPIHLRPVQAQASCTQNRRSAPAGDQAFYTYAKSRDLDIDEAILAGHFEPILALLDGYSIWLQSGSQADNLVARIGTAKTTSFLLIDPRTRDQYLRLLKQYLS